MKRKLNLLVSGLLLAFVAAFVGACSDDETKKKATEATELYFVDASDEVIQKFTIANPADMTTFLDVAGFSGVGLAYDKKHDKIYFTDFYEYYAGKIWTVEPDDTETLNDIVGDLYDPYSIVIADGKIYFADGADFTDEDGTNDASHIYSTNLDGTGKQALVTMANALFRPLAVDTKNDKIYYYDVEAENLYMADLSDGENQQVILAGAYGYAIAVDSKNGKIYFDDQNANDGDGALMMDDLDGSYPLTPTVADETASRIYGIAIDNVSGKLYWSARDNGEIYSADLDGQNKITLKTGLESPRGLFIK